MVSTVAAKHLEGVIDMKAYGVIGTLVCLALCACEPAKESTTLDESVDLAALTAVREQLRDGVRQANPELIASALDDDVALMAPDAPSVLGLEEARLWLEASFTEPLPDATYEVAEVELAGDWAFERGTYWGGEGKRLWIYRRQPDGGWKIRYIMFSSNSP